MALTNMKRSNSFSESLSSGLFSVEDVYIAVMGKTGSGKSTFIARCCNHTDTGIGHSLKSETQEIRLHTCTLNNKKIHLIDTPGFDDTYRSDSEVLRDLAYWLSKSYGAGFKLNGIVYLHPINETRVTGSAKKNLRTFKKLCGRQSLSSVVLATTMWNSITDPADGDRREADLKQTEEFWGGMIREGSTTFRHTNDLASAQRIVMFLSNKHSKTVLELQTEMVDQQKQLDDTEAGREVDHELRKQRERYKRELEDAKEEMQEALDNKDQQLADQIAREQEKTEQKIRDIQKGREELKTSMEKLIHEKDEQHNKEMATIKKELTAQTEATEKSIKDFNEYKEYKRIQDEQREKRQADLQEELDQAKVQAEDEKAILLYGALKAMEQQKEENEAREREMSAKVAAEERKRRELEDKEYQKWQAEALFQQQQQWMLTQQSIMQQNAVWNQYAAEQRAYSNALTVGMGATALGGLAAIGACVVM